MACVALIAVLLACNSVAHAEADRAKQTESKLHSQQHITAFALEEWERQYCVMHRTKKKKCQATIKDEEAHCAGLAKRSEFEQKFDPRCNDFKKEKAKCVASQEAAPTKHIKAAAVVCEKEVTHVCIQSSCPTYCKIKNKNDPDCDCEHVCEETGKSMWGTGALDCEGGDFEKCYADHNKALSGKGRAPELEALMREHLLKCVCVAREPGQRSTCYEGKAGIPEGKRWCDFDDTPSWRGLLKKAKHGQKFPKPECTEFP